VLSADNREKCFAAAQCANKSDNTMLLFTPLLTKDFPEATPLRFPDRGAGDKDDGRFWLRCEWYDGNAVRRWGANDDTLALLDRVVRVGQQNAN